MYAFMLPDTSEATPTPTKWQQYWNFFVYGMGVYDLKVWKENQEKISVPFADKREFKFYMRLASPFASMRCRQK